MNQEENKNKVLPELITFPFLDESYIYCGFSSRKGGFSRKPYDSLNIAYHVGDDRDDVRENRNIILNEVLHQGPGFIYSPNQVHGSNMIFVERDINHRDGDIPVSADSLMTDEEDVPIMVMGADCILILIADTVKRAVCAVHAGWRGTFERILSKSLKVFSGRFKSEKEDICAFLGPGIQRCCYSISEDLAKKFRQRFGEGSYLTFKQGRIFLDLAMLNRLQLECFGVPGEKIFECGICTSCDRKYFSYRREGITGRQGAIAMVCRMPAGRGDHPDGK